MKYLFSFLLVILTAVYGTAQKIDSASIAKLSPELRWQVNNYLTEARNAKTAAMVMCIGGGIVSIVGLLIHAEGDKEYNAAQIAYAYGSGEEAVRNSKQTSGTVLFVAGAACSLGSIPFFLKVHKKRNAARAIVFADKGMSLTPSIIVPGTQSAGIGLVLDLGRTR